HTSWPRDWSSDVCSSDLEFPDGHAHDDGKHEEYDDRPPHHSADDAHVGIGCCLEDPVESPVEPVERSVPAWLQPEGALHRLQGEIGRASCRERGWKSRVD